jgi:hypothetical protein
MAAGHGTGAERSAPVPFAFPPDDFEHGRGTAVRVLGEAFNGHWTQAETGAIASYQRATTVFRVVFNWQDYS